MNHFQNSGVAPMSRRDFSRVMVGGGLVALASGRLPAAAGTSSPTVGLTIGTYGMKTLAAPEALKLIKDTGYDGLQLAVMAGYPTDCMKLSAAERQTLRRQIEDSGLALPSLIDSIPLKTAADGRAKNLERLKRAVELGNDLSPSRAPFFDTILGQKKADWEKVKEAMVDELRTWVPILEAGHTTLTFKPHAGDAVQSAERVRWLLNAVNSSRIRITFDYSHFYVEGYDLEKSLREMIPYAPIIVVKDSVGTSEDHTFLLPGEGKTDYLTYFRLLKELNFSGYVNVEVSAMVHRKPGYDPVATTKLCYERLSPLMDRAGLVRPARAKAKA